MLDMTTSTKLHTAANTVAIEVKKLAWHRDPSVPQGQRANGSYDCTCGAIIEDVPFGGEQVHTCPGCGATYDGQGWVLSAAVEPTTEQVRAEAVLRVDARHRGCIPPAPAELADEYEREALHVASIARQYPWEQVVTKPPVKPMDANELYSGLTIRHDSEWRAIASTERVHRRVRVVFEDGSEAQMPATMSVRVRA